MVFEQSNDGEVKAKAEIQAKNNEVAPLHIADVQKRAAEAQAKAGDATAKLRLERVQAFTKAAPAFPEAMVPALLAVLGDPPGLPSAPAAASSEFDALRKLHSQLLPLHDGLRGRANDLTNPADPPPSPNAPVSEREDFQVTVANFVKSLSEYGKLQQEYERLCDPIVVDRLRTIIIPLAQNNRTPVTPAQFREILQKFLRPPLPIPDGPDSPVRDHFRTLSAETQNRLRVFHQRLFGPPVADAQARKKDPELGANYHVISGNLWHYIHFIETGRESEITPAAVEDLREAMYVHLLRRQQYEQAIRSPDAPAPHSLMGQWSFMMGILVARGPADRILPGLPPEAWRPHATDVGQLTQSQLETLVKQQDQLRQRLISRGCTAEQARRAVPDLTNLNQMLSDARIPNVARNFAMDCLRHNILDGVLLVLYLNSSPDKVRGMGNWMAMMGMNASISAGSNLLMPYILQAAARSPACAALLVRSLRTAGPWITAGLAVTIMLLGHERVDRAVQDLDTMMFHTLGLPGRDQLNTALALPGDVFNFIPRAASRFGLSTVDPQRGFLDYMTNETFGFRLPQPGLTLAGPADFIERGYHRGISDWNARVEQAQKQQTNPVLRNLWGLETIQGEGSQSQQNFARRRSAEMLRRLPALLDAERQLNTLLGDLGILNGPPLNFVSVAIDDDPANRRNDQVLYRQANISGRFLAITRGLEDNNSSQAAEKAGRDDALGGARPHAHGIGRIDKLLSELQQKRKAERAKKIEQAGKAGAGGIPEIEPLPTGADIQTLFQNYRGGVEQLAQEISVYRHMGIYADRGGVTPGGVEQWFGNNWQTMGTTDGNYQMTPFVVDGMVLEIARNTERRESLLFRRSGAVTPRQFAQQLGECLQHPRYDLWLELQSPRGTKTEGERINESIQRSQLYKQISVMCGSIGDMFPDADRNDASAEIFNRALDPIRSLVLLFADRGAPSLEEVRALHAQVSRIVDEIAKQSRQNVALNERVLGVNALPCRVIGMGPPNARIARTFGTLLNPTAEQVRKNSLGQYPFYSFIVIRNHVHQGQMQGTMFSFDCPSPNRSTWQVRIHHTHEQFSDTQNVHSQSWFDGRGATLESFRLTANGDAIRFASWASAQQDLAKSLELEFQSVEARLKKAAEEEKAKEEKLAEERRKAEAVGKVVLEHNQNNTSVFRRVPAALRDPALEAGAGYERRMRYGDSIISWRHNRAPTVADRERRSYHDNPYYRRNWYTGFMFAIGGVEQQHHLPDPNRSIGEDSDRFTFTVATAVAGGGERTRTYEIDSWTFLNSTRYSPQEKDMIVALLCTPSEGTESSDTGYGIAPLIRMARLFPRRVIIGDRLERSGKVFLVDELADMYERSTVKHTFLRFLWSDLLTMVGEGRHLDDAEVRRIKEAFRKRMGQSMFRGPISPEDHPDREPVLLRLDPLEQQGASIEKTVSAAGASKIRTELLADVSALRADLQAFRKSVMAEPIPAIVSMYQQVQSFGERISRLQKRTVTIGEEIKQEYATKQKQSAEKLAQDLGRNGRLYCAALARDFQPVLFDQTNGVSLYSVRAGNALLIIRYGADGAVSFRTGNITEQDPRQLTLQEWAKRATAALEAPNASLEGLDVFDLTEDQQKSAAVFAGRAIDGAWEPQPNAAFSLIPPPISNHQFMVNYLARHSGIATEIRQPMANQLLALRPSVETLSGQLFLQQNVLPAVTKILGPSPVIPDFETMTKIMGTIRNMPQ